MELKSTRYEVDADGVAVIQLSRPDRRNAWTGRMHAEYRWCCANAERNPLVRVIVVHGNPDGKAFCVGADSDALAGHVARGGYDDGITGLANLAQPGAGAHEFLDAHFAWQLGLRIPIVVAINGACAGVALALAAFADIRFVAKDAVLATAAPKLGLPAEYGLSWILPRLIPRMHAIDVLLSGRRFRGTEAAAWGFAIESDDPAQAVADAVTYARNLATGVSSASVEMTKRQLAQDLLRHDVGASVRESDVLLAQAMTGPDFVEGVAALRERRAPEF
jgi:enoyl-CoA hydratase/carnithine racemase